MISNKIFLSFEKMFVFLYAVVITYDWLIDWLINPLECFFGIEGHAALDRNPGPGYNTLLLRLIPGDLYSACPHRQFHTLPGLLHSRAALPNSYPNACVPSREAVCTIFMMVFGMTRPGREPTTYRMRGGHANHWAIPTRCWPHGGVIIWDTHPSWYYQ